MWGCFPRRNFERPHTFEQTLEPRRKLRVHPLYLEWRKAHPQCHYTQVTRYHGGMDFQRPMIPQERLRGCELNPGRRYFSFAARQSAAKLLIRPRDILPLWVRLHEMRREHIGVCVQNASGIRGGRVSVGRMIPYKSCRAQSGDVSCGAEHVPCRYWLQEPYYSQFHRKNRA